MTAYDAPELLLRSPQPQAEPTALPGSPPAGGDARGPGLGIELRGVHKRYGAREVLHDIHLSIAPGEFVAVIGKSGCGKSTLLRLLAGLEAADAGALAIDAQPPNATREDTRLMFQDARLLPWKRVAGNVELGLSSANAPARARGALAQVGLADRAHEWPAVLSGGQKQRVALARALVHEPRLLLLDEPLGALDALTRLEMQALIEQLWREQGFTAVLVTHDVAEAAALADRVLVIVDGRIAHEERIVQPRPRRHASAALAEVEERLLAQVLRRPG
ncbi:MAG: ATP-binding cassette domain-containing protein [Rubrivivax sp.]|nr:ATP-binding cassette domain-containing protein [Rubrivivax sp.]